MESDVGQDGWLGKAVVSAILTTVFGAVLWLAVGYFWPGKLSRDTANSIAKPAAEYVTDKMLPPSQETELQRLRRENERLSRENERSYVDRSPSDRPPTPAGMKRHESIYDRW